MKIHAVIFAVAAMLALVPLLRAGYGSGDPRLEKLYGEFIAPCCWSENLTVHNSQVAEQLRAQIAEMVRAGKSDDDIKAALVGAYGKRILALPEGGQRAWLFVTPVAAVALGLIFVCIVLFRMRKQEAPA
jgi:cytochrome c-type biogenesis protein CcmH